MKAFHDDQAVKEKYLARVRKHIEMDELVRGVGYEIVDGKVRACAVGCSLDKYDHAAYETELGIPEWLARVEDTLFEGMPKERSRTWPEKFLEAIPLGVDLECVRVPFVCLVLEHTLVSMDACKYDASKWPEVKPVLEGSKAAVREMIAAQKSGNKKLIEAARSAADSAVYSARSARSARSASSAYSAAADSASLAAYSAAADSASLAAYSAAAYSAAASSAAYDYYAARLLELLGAAK